jgi:ABC-type multidrug transport system ATPase subunit
MSRAAIQSIVSKDMCVGYRPLDANNPALAAVSKHISFEVHRGELMAIMGPSGSGKSTLLRGLLGRAPHVSGKIFVNGEDCSSRGGLGFVSHKVGMVPQSDVLVDELSMMENIRYFHTIAVDSGMAPSEIDQRAEKELAELGLHDDPSQPFSLRLTRKRVGDGSGRKSNISGGQAKRANIAMELVNDPDVLIIDEPTSGLSSHDSLELLKKLKDIAAAGKIVIIIIHQPSSEIFGLFDRVLLLDGKGHCVRSGTRAEMTAWANGQVSGGLYCGACKSSFPDKLLSLIETKANWQQESFGFSNAFSPAAGELAELPRKPMIRPFQAWFDLMALFSRSLLVRWRDKSSMLLSFVAPPLLGVLFASVFSASPPNAEYSFPQNGLFPQLVFMLIICTMFLGMVGAGVEVIRDRPMLDREVSRGLKLWAYYGTKFAAVMLFGIVQTALLATSVSYMSESLHLAGTLFVALFLVMAMGVSLGLLISVFSQTPTKAFYLVLLVLLPQIVLGGALLPYRDMGKALYLGEVKVADNRPLMAAFMPASWAHQFTMRLIYDQSQDVSVSAINLAVADMRHIPMGGFMSLKPARQLKPQPLEALGLEMPAAWSTFRAKSYSEDALVLVAIAIGGLLMGWAWVGKPYQLSGVARLHRMAVTTVALGGIPFVLVATAAVVPKALTGATDKEAGIDFTVTSAPMNLTAATQHCASLGSRLPQLQEFLDVYSTKHQDLVSGTYWIANESPPNSVSVISSAALAKSGTRPLTAKAVRTSKGTMVQNINPTQRHRFLCVPMPKLPAATPRN